MYLQLIWWNNLLYIIKLPGARFQLNLEKEKVFYILNRFLYFVQWNVLPLVLKKLFIFINYYIFLYFGKRNPLKSSLYFRIRKPSNVSYISRNGNLQFSAEPLKNKQNKPKENLLYSGKMDLPSSNIKKSFIISQKKAFLIFQERKPPKINSSYFRKKNFLIFREQYIQNPSMFRTRSIFRTLVYSEPVVYCRVTCTTFTTFAQAQKIKKSPLSKKKKKKISSI